MVSYSECFELGIENSRDVGSNPTQSIMIGSLIGKTRLKKPE
jgi:hypothetical protein